MYTTLTSPAARRGTLLAWAILLALPVAVMACPNCKLSVEDTDGAVQGVTTGPAGHMAAGYAYSIYLMLSMPAALGLALVLFIRRQVLAMDRNASPVRDAASSP